MNTIKRDVYVLKNTIKIPIEITQGTDMIGIEFTVRDFTIPATAAVVAYANHKSMSRPNSALCELADNVIAFSLSSGFFAVGMNELQIRIINEDKTLVSFAEKVKCSGSAGFPDDEEEGKQTLVEQAVTAVSKESGERKTADENEKAQRIAGDQEERDARIEEEQTYHEYDYKEISEPTGTLDLADVKANPEKYLNYGNEPKRTDTERIDVLEATTDDIILMMADLIGGEA
ncbi:hypothetical protein [Coprococcus comes]|uniref:hypothetical protein n=1 Tax=Coprococcus comes TaxID=410072 RepID=UPI001571197A|nr:hypothetical protein [Coprococcus comes]NSG42021.1 hypothetical protein [Coprococcus comes]